ncbi:MAG: ABC transporter permease [Rhodospirillaceae bacterium]|nr:ABC transporter permease [Rhodospirillaceae bacterium]
MDAFAAAFAAAGDLILSADAGLVEIIALSLEVSLIAVGLSALIGMPLGGLIALATFPGRRAIIVVFNALMGLPPVVVGLVVYLLLSRSGPFGVLDLLFTPTAMIVAQVILVLPIIVSLTRQILEFLWIDYRETLRSFGATRIQCLATLLWDGRFMLVTALLAGFGRAIAEVGAVMIVGGNIDHLTRVMTTAIALEASKGELALALGLGLILLAISLVLNVLAQSLRSLGETWSLA